MKIVQLLLSYLYLRSFNQSRCVLFLYNAHFMFNIILSPSYLGSLLLGLTLYTNLRIFLAN